MVKNLPAVEETQVRSLGGEDTLEKGTAPHSRILAWKISWTEPGGLQSMGSQRVGHDERTHTCTFPSPISESGSFVWGAGHVSPHMKIQLQ